MCACLLVLVCECNCVLVCALCCTNAIWHFCCTHSHYKDIAHTRAHTHTRTLTHTRTHTMHNRAYTHVAHTTYTILHAHAATYTYLHTIILYVALNFLGGDLAYFCDSLFIHVKSCTLSCCHDNFVTKIFMIIVKVIHENHVRNN